jgi:nucleotide-binding universal stress UspA family protein
VPPSPTLGSPMTGDLTPTAERPIVVAWDGSSYARDALTLGALLARESGAPLELVHVGPRWMGMPARFDEAADGVLDAVPTDLLEGVRTGRQVVTGTSPSHGLQYAAADLDARMVVLGSTHRGHVGRVLPGSVAQHLLHGGPCAVAVAPVGYAHSAPESLRVIVAAFNSSPESRAALRAAEDLAVQAGATLRVVTVVAPYWYGWASAGFAYEGAVPNDDQREACRRALDEVLPTLAAAVRAAGHLREGSPPQEIAAEAEAGADLLVMGSRGYGAFGRVMLGSVSSDVLRHAPCPVLIAPPAATAEQDRRPREPDAERALG